MSIISAGTTTTTALSSTGNTDGTLQFQVNGTTPSVTLNTLGAIGVGSSPSFGTSGQVLTSGGSTVAPTWTTATSSQWTTNGTSIYYNTGNVGIGTSTPAEKLHLDNGASDCSVRVAGRSRNLYLGQDVNGALIYSDGAASMNFYTNAVERMRLNTSGTVILQGGSTSATGIGITFPATQSASTDANTLDDYEEGTWTPSIGGTATYNEAVGNYVKVGKMVTVNADIWIASIGTGSAGTISGLPFTKASGYNQGCYTYYWNALSVSITNLYPWIDTTTVKFHTVGAAATGVNNTVNIFQNNARVQFTAVYYI